MLKRNFAIMLYFYDYKNKKLPEDLKFIQNQFKIYVFT